MKKLVMGVLAHVDSGKTTLSEGLLYLTGSIRKAGRVDHGNTALDTNEIEKSRGITVFSKQAMLTYNDIELCLLDTPGHVDFGAEAERTLQVLDCAVLIISSLDGVQNHTVTLWNLLKNYNVPVFVFINKMDLAGADKAVVLSQLKKELSAECIDFSADEEIYLEECAMADETVMDSFLEKGTVSDNDISQLIAGRKIFPCFFGSALKMDGLENFLSAVARYAPQKEYGEKFGAKVFKISYDGNDRLTFMKITGGSLKVKDSVPQVNKNGESHTEKVNRIRLYTGEKFRTEQELTAGSICAVTGLNHTYPGQGLGTEKNSRGAVLQAIFSYKVLFDSKYDVRTVLQKLRQLEEEEPQLHVEWKEQVKEIHLSLMGEIQLEIIKTLFFQRYGIEIDFDAGSVLYKETIANTVEGVGHYEPLRHYSEVHLLMEPGKAGSGLVFDTLVSEDKLDRNWQRLILTHLKEKTHIGVLTGSPITDMKITLVNGRAHLKHTEGGDFRQSTYRAVRQGLMQAESVLLEPWYDFEITVPTENIGRVMTDIQKMSGEFNAPQQEGDKAVLTGYAPVSEINSYGSEIINFTRGKGRILLQFKGYLPCHNADEVIVRFDYNPESDLVNIPDSVFCTHGAGFVVKWDEVKSKMHLESFLKTRKEQEERPVRITPRQVEQYYSSLEADKELMKIFEQTYGKIKTDKYLALKSAPKNENTNKNKPVNYDREFLLVDGYNIIFAWEHLKKIAAEDIEDARHKLANTLCNYQGFKNNLEVILVFDAYKVKGNVGEISKYHNITIVYTKEAETADMYIEKVTHQIARNHRVRVATSDGLEQIIILGHGAMRMSASALLEEVGEVEKAIREFLQ
ncbi:MAG: TetM/TetW/TetO/TetS family tetracycline resistance ribosomal protection protein [Oscillospiraceae bacterium]|nr:TetM/TetW/TetO/TetS family tetracycline resistance ribosomal protection protein [Oscillospiraceae bacterium]